jgi:dTMP kinase
MYLNGQLGKDAKKLNPYMCSTFYAVDRAIQFCQELNDIYSREDSILICDRYLSANIIHQGAKFKSAEDKKKFFEWVYDLEVDKNGLPLEDITIVLSVPVDVSQGLMTKRYDGHNEKKDIHESDIEYLKLCYDTVNVAVEHLNSKGFNWKEIDCSDGKGSIRTREDISNDIWLAVKDII